MDAELTNLETRLAALLDAYQSVRAENRELSARVATLQVENHRLAEKVSLATERVERLLTRLPLKDEA